MAYEAKTNYYIPPTDPLVKQKLEKWQDLKLGLMMHWAPYSIIGALESWSICSEHEEWISRPMENYEEYKRFYKSLYKVFNPVKFEPQAWAEAAKNAGMKYVIPTTKHHDGFCMFDTRQTDFKITSSDCPFSKNPKANILSQVLEAFRRQDFMAGVYFSKPDWSCEHYWWPYYATPDRHVNYDPAKHPQKWQQFKDFTYNQIRELMTEYGQVDILWLDGAWVRPIENMPGEYAEWAKKKNWNQDIDMAGIAGMVRKHQPGLIVVDRWVSGEFENYLTPEQTVPGDQVDYPWEACMTMTADWSYRPHEEYKPLRQLLYTFVDIVAKGGNLLLNVGPKPDGSWPQTAYERLERIGDWLKINGEAIYGSRPIAPFTEKNICFTQQKSGCRYALIKSENDQMPEKVQLPVEFAADPKSVKLLGIDRELEWQNMSNNVLVSFPEGIRNNPPCDFVWTICFK